MKKTDFNRGWTVQKQGEDSFTVINLPHDAMIYEKRSSSSPAAGACGYFLPGAYIYEKVFDAPEEWRDRQVILELEAVYQNASVSLNGRDLAVRPYGYTNFFVDLTGELTWDGENRLRVIADNAKAPNSRWYSGSGIIRPVWLYTGPKTAIAPQGIHVETPEKDLIRVSLKLQREEAEVSDDAPLLCRITILAGAEGKACSEKPADAASPGNPANEASPDKPMYEASPDKPTNEASPDKPTNEACPDKPKYEACPDKPKGGTCPGIPEGENILCEVCGNAGEPLEITVPGLLPWSAEHPNLYRCRASLLEDGEVIDTDETVFGVRKLEWGGEGLRVNGEEVLLRGACIHHDNGVLGAACFADAEERRVRILKEAGFNAIRSAHNPISKAMLDACDRLGMYVMDESFDMWLIHKNPYDYGKEKFSDWWMADTAAMIEKDFNHPSVIMYSIGNEISELGTEEGQNLCRQMAEYVRSLDGARPVTLGINLMLASMVAKGKGLYGNGGDDGKENSMGSASMDSAPTSAFFNVLMNRMGSAMEMASRGKGAGRIADKVSDCLDIPGYNYAAPRYKEEAKIRPDRAFVGAETLPKTLWRNWQLVKSIPQLIGDFIWTGWDYLGESGIGTVRYLDRKTKKPVEDGLIISGGPGVIDLCGYPRAEVGWNKSIWGLKRTPTIGVDPVTHAGDFRAVSMWRDTDAVESWSWAGCEGRKTNVVVYSDAAYVALKVNGKSYGRKKVRGNAAHFKGVRYNNGSIAAAAYDRTGRMISRTRLRTADGRTSISVSPEKKALRANGQDLCFLNISLTGENGVVKSSEDRKLTVKAEGTGTLQGFGSARPCMSENFVSDSHTTFYGRALAVIRAGYEPGLIRVTVSSEGLAPQTVIIRTE